MDEPLSFREAQIGALVAQGKTNKIIAYELDLTANTVRQYIHEMFVKLGVTNRVELAIRMLTTAQLQPFPVHHGTQVPPAETSKNANG